VQQIDPSNGRDGPEAPFLAKSWNVRFTPQAAEKQTCHEVGLVPIVLQKSFCTGDQNFCGLQAQLSCKDVRDLIASR
jgi:hypothetical protein